MRKLLTKGFILISVVFLIVGCPKSEVELYGSIEGIVTDDVTNEPITGALVTISPLNTSKNTGSDGRYFFEGLEPALFTVQVSNSGYETNTKTITIEPGETRNGDIKLTPIIPVIRTSVTALDYGSNLTSLPVEITNIGRGKLHWLVSENVSWISVNPISGETTSETDNIIISLDRSNLSIGNYESNINITSDGGSAIIAITLTVQ